MKMKVSTKSQRNVPVKKLIDPLRCPANVFVTQEYLKLKREVETLKKQMRSIIEVQKKQVTSPPETSCVSADPCSSSSLQSSSSSSSQQNKRSCLRSRSPSSYTVGENPSKLPSKRRKRKLDIADEQQERQARKVAYIHVGEGGERDLEDHLRGSSRVNVQILSTEQLPDIDASDMIHGLDSSGTSRDYVDEQHRCNVACPQGCQGHLRQNEIVIYESIRFEGKLFGRKRIKGRFVTDGSGVEDVVSLDMTDFRRMGSERRSRGAGGARPRREVAPSSTARTAARRRTAEVRRERTRASETCSSSPPTVGQLGLNIPRQVGVLIDSPQVSLSVAQEHSWSSEDKSFNIVLKEGDPLVMRRHPIAQSTDCIRGKTGYSSGVHLFEVTWPVRQRGTHAVLGVATREAPLHAVGYQSLVGNSDQSWGWDLGRVKVFHNNIVQNSGYYPSSLTQSHQWTVPETFKMVLDMNQGRLGFMVADQWLGWAVSGLKDSAPLYPIASTVWGHCEVKLKYLHGLDSSLLSLQDLSRIVIRETIESVSDKDNMRNKIDRLPLPVPLKKFVKYL